MPHPELPLTLAQTALGDLVQVHEPDDPLVPRPGVPLGLWFPDSTEADGSADRVTPEEGVHAHSEPGKL